MQPTDIHQTIAYQIDNQKPAHLVPGKHIGMEVVDAHTVRVLIIPTGVLADVRYLPGPDLYRVTVERATEDEPTVYDGVYCDQLGDLIFGEDAEPATYPMVEVWAVNPATGEMEKVS